jgi:uncharacterized protein YfdQ (DUF2303 family)
VSDLKTDAAVVVETATLAAQGQKLDFDQRVYAFALPEGGTAQLLDLEKYFEAPARTKGTYKLTTTAGFISFVAAEEAPEGRRTIWVDDKAFMVTALFNDASGATPAWRDHRAVLKLQKTPEWVHWASLDGKLVGQQEFAEHIETGLEEIREPDSATMLEIAQSFFATTNAEFRTAQRLTDGQVRVQYDEEIKASAGGKGELEVPQKFTLAVAPFVGETPYSITARLRYRVGGGNLRLGYQLDHPERVLSDALQLIADGLLEKFPGAVFLGEPAAPQG